MRVWCIAVGLSLGLMAAPAFAQTAATHKPAAPPAPAAKAQPPAPFPAGAKIAYVDIQRIAAESSAGRASSARVQALVKQKQAEGSAKAKQLQADEQRLQQSGSVMSDDARTALQQKVQQEQIDVRRFQEDAQRQIQDLQQDLQQKFEQKLMPVIQQVVTEKGVQILLSRADAGIVWATPSLDLTSEVIQKLDAEQKPAARKPGLR